MSTRTNVASSLLSIALAACAAPAGTGPDHEADAGRAALEADGAPGTTVDPLATCPGAYPTCFTCGSNSCGQPCCAYESEPGFEIWYLDDCTAWAQPNWQRKNAPGLVCHLDLDQHWNKVTIEINVADPYEDVGCAHQPDHWQKYKADETSCSFFTGEGECQSRVEEKVGALAAQGYVPIVADVDDDQCPYPRL